MTTENNNEQFTEEVSPPTEAIMAAPKAAPEMTIGKLIRQKREQKDLSLKFISQQTKIHIGLLENLEADQLDKLPSKTYIRGFVKSTSKLLGLDQEYALDLLDRAYVEKDSKNKPESPNLEMRNETARNTLSTMAATPLEAVKSVTASSGVFLAKIGVTLLIIGVVGFNIKNMLDKSSEEDEIKLPEVMTTLHQKSKVVIKPAPVAPVAPPAPVEPLKINLIQDKNQKTNVTVNDISMQTISLGEKQFTEDTSMSKETIDELLPAKYRVQTVKGTETLFINASQGDSWLTYKVDDKEIKKYVLRQGRTLFLRGSTIRAFIGNTKSVTAFYNNKPINLTANTKSTVKNIVLPEELKTKFMAPLFVFQEDGSVMTSDEYIKTNQNKPNTATTPVSPAKKAVEAPKNL